MRTRLTTLLTVGFLTLGTGGALATFGGGDFGSGGGGSGSAGFHEYRCERGHDQRFGRDGRCRCEQGSPSGSDRRCNGQGGDGGDNGGGDKRGHRSKGGRG
jgi:hypothetical protein